MSWRVCWGYKYIITRGAPSCSHRPFLDALQVAIADAGGPPSTDQQFFGVETTMTCDARFLKRKTRKTRYGIYTCICMCIYIYTCIFIYIIDYDIVIFYVGCRFARYMRYVSFSLTVCNATCNFQTVISSKKNMLAAHCRFYKVESYYLDWLLTYTFWEHPAPWLTLPGTNMAPENTPGPKRKLIFQSHWFPVLS